VTETQVSHLGKFIADFHTWARVIPTPFDLASARDRFNDLETVKSLVDQNLEPGASRIIPNALKWSNSFLKHHASRLRERVVQGYKRDLHGDLHSANIFLYKQPVIFDCIDFNDAYRHVDVLDEVAFLCMDLESFNEPHLARTLLNSYSERVPCLEKSEDLEIFLYYKCYRANVRAKVHAIAAGQEQDQVKRNNHIERMVQHLCLIERYVDS
jgi:aminoglycoside phosphotransferase family enzyme